MNDCPPVENEAGEVSYAVGLRLMIKHPTASNRLITEKIRLTPTHGWNVGEQWQTPRGSTSGRVRLETYWNYHTTLFNRRDFFSVAHDFFKSIDYCHDFLKELHDTKGVVVLEISLDGSKNIGDVSKSNELFALLMKYRVSFGLEVFPNGFAKL